MHVFTRGLYLTPGHFEIIPWSRLKASITHICAGVHVGAGKKKIPGFHFE